MAEAVRILEYPERKKLIIKKVIKKKKTVALAKTKVALGLLLLVTTFGLPFGILIGYNQLETLSEESQRLSQEIFDLESEKDLFTVQLEPYLEETRMRNLAKTRLAMTEPKDSQIQMIHLGQNQKVANTNQKAKVSIFGSIASIVQEQRNNEASIQEAKKQ